MQSAASKRVRFGTFELDLTTGELHSTETAENDKVLLREQVFQVLGMLVERAGKIVTREEIKSRLWPNDTVVDFDHSINATINALRRALGDSADNPRYIETLARRGYRLMVATEYLESTRGVGLGKAPSVQVRPQPGSLTGKKISHYRVLDVIGGGGMAMVYKAEDLALGRHVALKFLPEELAGDPVAVKRFVREAQTASALNHPNICTIYEIEQQESEPFIAMELLQGDTLRGRMEDLEPNPLPLLELLDIAIQACDGLEAAHANGIIHRDIKPANIFLTNNGTVKILDFGLAKLAAVEKVAPEGPPETLSPRSGPTDSALQISATLTRPGTTAGTAAYMSPEQVRNEELDSRTDLFSLGLVLYQAVTGKRAFAGETRDAIHHAILHQTPPAVRDLNPAVPRKLDAVITKALVKDRSGRYQSAIEMRQDLTRMRKDMQPGRHRMRRELSVAALLTIAVLGSWSYWNHGHRITLSPTDTIVLADINNQTSDPVFDDSLNTAMRYSLQQTPYLNVLGVDKVVGTLGVLKLPLTTKLTPEVARQVCNHTQSKMVLASSVADVGNRFGLQLNATDCASGKVVAQVRKDLAGRNEIVQVLGHLAAELRGKLGEPSTSLDRFNKRLDVALSPSLEALEAATIAYKHHTAGDVRGAVPYYQRALELDPNFALVYEGLGVAELFLGDRASEVAALTKAYELRSRMTEPERLHTENIYLNKVTGETEKACSVLVETVRTFPRDVIAHNNLAACLSVLGQPERAAPEAREAARLQPSPWAYFLVMDVNILADRLQDAKTAYDEAKAHNFDSPELRDQRLRLAFLQNDRGSLQDFQSLAATHPDPGLLNELMELDEYHGRRRSAQRLLEQIVALAAKQGGRQYDRIGQALYDAKIGDLSEARRVAAVSLQGVRDPNRKLALALAFALAGEVEQAQKLTDTLGREFPSSTIVQKYCLPAIRAGVKLHADDPAGAVEALQPTLEYDLGDNGTDCFGSLYPAYIRGLAYLRMGEFRSAAAQFQKVLDHPGIVGLNSNGPLSRLQLARTQKMMGDEVGARKSYEDFLTLWKDADADIPIYRGAKAEYAKLRK